MSWNILKKAITDVIKTNGNEEITGQNLQNTLVSMVNALGDNSTFAGFALPTTNPGNPDGPVFYLANVAGVYSNFSGYEVKEGEAVVLNWDGSGNWSKHTLTTGAGGSNSVKDLGNIDDNTAFAYLANLDNLVTKNDDVSYNFNKPILYTWNSGSNSNLVISISGDRFITQLHFGHLVAIKLRVIRWSLSRYIVETITDWNDYAVNSSRAGFMTPSMLKILEGASGVMGGNAQVIEWSHTHNMNDYKEAGTYRIKGERTGSPMDDNLPIMNSGSGHTIEGILYVLDSSLTNGSGKPDDCTVTQFLMLSNRVGGQEGDMYMRSGYGANKDNLTWKPWEKYQTNIEVGAVSDDATHDAITLAPINSNGLNTLVDNGVYSGVYLTQEALGGDGEKAETFVMVVINNYFIAKADKTITQIKFAVATNGTYSQEYRTLGSDGSWSEWNNEMVEVKAAIEDLQNTKAPKVGYAPDLKVNFAKELVGRGEATPQVIGQIRPTGEISIGDGNATIEKVKGRSVVWNQKLSLSGQNVAHATLEDIGEYYKITPKSATANRFQQTVDVIENHVYFQRAIVYGTGNNEISFCNYLGLHVKTSTSKTSNSTPSLIWGIANATETVKSYIQASSIESLEPFWIKKNSFLLYDLTQMFGAGNEPTTIEEFEARRPFGVTDDYNEGEIISYDGANALHSVGFNAYNGTYAKVIGGQKYHALGNITSIGFTTEMNGETTAITLDSEGMFTPTEDGYVHAEGSDICIHLAHTYTPEHTTEYEEDTLQLPDVKSIKDKDGNPLFPYGLLSAGSVHDEISATKVIKRIGVVNLGELEWVTYRDVFISPLTGLSPKSGTNKSVICTRYITYSPETIYTDTTVIGISGAKEDYWIGIGIRDAQYQSTEDVRAALSGVLLYYELADPIEVDLEEPLNLTYEAWDFGTEELHTEAKTTPLNANISYQFNAVDRIRENTTKASDLEARVMQLEAMLTQMAQANESNEYKQHQG